MFSSFNSYFIYFHSISAQTNNLLSLIALRIYFVLHLLDLVQSAAKLLDRHVLVAVLLACPWPHALELVGRQIGADVVEYDHELVFGTSLHHVTLVDASLSKYGRREQRPSVAIVAIVGFVLDFSELGRNKIVADRRNAVDSFLWQWEEEEVKINKKRERESGWGKRAIYWVVRVGKAPRWWYHRWFSMSQPFCLSDAEACEALAVHQEPCSCSLDLLLLTTLHLFLLFLQTRQKK